MENFNLDLYLKDHPAAAEDAATIKRTRSKLQKLRARGIGGEGYTLTEPFGARGRQITGNKKARIPNLKRTFVLDR